MPSQPKKNPAGIEIRPGLDSGNHDQSAPVISAVSEPDTTGEEATSTTQVIRPP